VYEILPVVAGVVFGGGLLWFGPRSSSMRVIASIVFALVAGFIAASVSGEIEESWAFVLLDAAFTLVATAVALWGLPKLGLGSHRHSA